MCVHVLVLQLYLHIFVRFVSLLMQLLAELGRNQGDHHIQTHFHNIWKEQLLPKLVEVFKVELTPIALKRLKSLITDEETNFDKS